MDRTDSPAGGETRRARGISAWAGRRRPPSAPGGIHRRVGLSRSTARHGPEVPVIARRSPARRPEDAWRSCGRRGMGARGWRGGAGPAAGSRTDSMVRCTARGCARECLPPRAPTSPVYSGRVTRRARMALGDSPAGIGRLTRPSARQGAGDPRTHATAVLAPLPRLSAAARWPCGSTASPVATAPRKIRSPQP